MKNVKLWYIFLSTAFLGFLLVTICSIVDFGARSTSNLFVFAYPFYQSCRTIQSREFDNFKGLINYWMFFSGFSVIDSFSSILMFWFPFYWLAKVSIFNNSVSALYLISFHWGIVCRLDYCLQWKHWPEFWFTGKHQEGNRHKQRCDYFWYHNKMHFILMRYITLFYFILKHL